ncbi:hypothetical protein [Litoribacillus peritrichatus]|uniref:Uncharacterized protein n=1 Tax=Litoribacillus peritrichatus TaxID=718191 RepID=A0ABP7NBX9_9GAMM
MTLDDLLNKTCLIGLTYFNAAGDLLKQVQLSGSVISVHEENGIAVRLDNQTEEASNIIAVDSSGQEDPDLFVLPPSLSAWFIAPKGHYRNSENNVDVKNPDYFVTWDIQQKQDDSNEGEHEWWSWEPRTIPPQVN